MGTKLSLTQEKGNPLNEQFERGIAEQRRTVQDGGKDEIIISIQREENEGYDGFVEEYVEELVSQY